MTNIFTIANLNNDTREVIAHDDRATAVKMLAERLIEMNDSSRDRASAERCIAEGMVYQTGYKARSAVFLDSDPVEFWSTLARAMTDDSVDFCEGTEGPWDQADEDA